MMNTTVKTAFEKAVNEKISSAMRTKVKVANGVVVNLSEAIEAELLGWTDNTWTPELMEDHKAERCLWYLSFGRRTLVFNEKEEFVGEIPTRIAKVLCEGARALHRGERIDSVVFERAIESAWNRLYK